MNENLKMEESDNQKFCLKWNNFHNNFMSQFEMLKEDEDFVDVTLSCYGQSIKAHKVVLSACSPYLKSIFKENPCKHPIIILDNLSFNNLKAVIQFVYTGQVYVQQTELSSFLKAAETLQIRGLTETSEENITKTHLPPNSETISQIASRKRELDVETENKKIANKRIAKKVSSGAIKEKNDFREREEQEDCSSNNIRSFKENLESSSLVTCVPEQSVICEEKSVSGSFGEEEWSAGDPKKPHWLDPRSCPMCNRTYSNLSNLRQHMKLIHNPTLVTCKLCYKTFKTDLYLRRHLISFHELNMNGNNFVSLPVQNQPPSWNPNVKKEPETFEEIYGGNEMYQLPE